MHNHYHGRHIMDMLREQLKSTRESLQALWRAADFLAEGHDDCALCGAFLEDHGDEADLYDSIDELPLEIVWEKGQPFIVVLGTGGPHVEIRGGGRHDGMSYTLHGYWAGEHVTLTGESITRTGEYFREQVEEVM